ncbi:MAG: SWIM zinc finger family protein [Propionibacteriaceae bacterium]|nr:SWIM zinc finger family protein [Propionibacteriaceae bacterium]
MGEAWSVQRVEAAAPDSKSVLAGRKLATPGPWSDIGVHGNLLWGSCQGSGKTPYQVSIDTAAPAYKCSCPSRKFPCKHAIALLFLWVQGQISETGEVAAFASTWNEAREARAEAKSAPPREQTAEQKAAAAARLAQREEWVSAGLAELDRFLADQVREGLATHAAERTERLERIAARMVDAQASAVASRLREIAAAPQVGQWPARLLDDYASLHLLARAWAGRDALPADLAETVRSRVGFTRKVNDVLATPGVRDQWVVLGMRDADEEQVSVRRVWLWGRHSGTRALVLFFSQGRAGLDASLYPGTEIDADLHFYPGRPRLRAAVGTRHGGQDRVSGWDHRGTSLAQAVAELREAVAADPWLESWPVAVWGAPTHHDGEFWLHAEAGLRLTGTPTDLWRLLAETGSLPTTVFGELSAEGLRPVAFLTGGQVRVL